MRLDDFSWRKCWGPSSMRSRSNYVSSSLGRSWTMLILWSSTILRMGWRCISLSRPLRDLSPRGPRGARQVNFDSFTLLVVKKKQYLNPCKVKFKWYGENKSLYECCAMSILVKLKLISIFNYLNLLKCTIVISNPVPTVTRVGNWDKVTKQCLKC